MKEATGELNMTVVTIVAVAALLAFFYLVIWPNLQAGMALSSACNASNGTAYTTTGGDSNNAWTINCTARSGNTPSKCTYRKGNKTSTRVCSDN